MTTVKHIDGGVSAPLGFKAAGVHAGIKAGSVKPDLALIVSDCECAAAAVYTTNKVQGAPIAVTREHIKDGRARAMLCNSGNANTCAPNGEDVARECCALAAQATGLKAADFIVASTGVIGQELSLEPFRKGMPELVKGLSREGSRAAAQAIMTTDTRMKEFAAEFNIGESVGMIGVIGKGSGMINVNMATMLIFITTDVAISPAMLSSALSEAVAVSLNQICIDGDTSTNDMAAILASGLAGNPAIEAKGADYDDFLWGLSDVLVRMSRALARDGEGATKLLECEVRGAQTEELARRIAKTVVASDLLKAAMFGGDANWGRVLCAIGYTKGDFPVDRISLTLSSREGAVQVCENSAHREFSEAQAARILAEDEVRIEIDMNDGDSVGMAWGCDLTYDYVKINGDYRS